MSSWSEACARGISSSYRVHQGLCPGRWNEMVSRSTPAARSRSAAAPNGLSVTSHEVRSLGSIHSLCIAVPRSGGRRPTAGRG